MKLIAKLPGQAWGTRILLGTGHPHENPTIRTNDLRRELAAELRCRHKKKAPINTVRIGPSGHVYLNTRRILNIS